MFNAPNGANMENATYPKDSTRAGSTVPVFAPLDHETRAAVDTATAAYHLSRRPQTLRGWACKEDGPLRPVRVHGRLAWPVTELRRVLSGA